MLGEDVEDERDAVDDLDLDDILESAPLAGREFGVDDHGVGADGFDDLLELGGLAAAEIRSRVRLVAALDDRVEDFGACGLGEGSEFADRVLGFVEGRVPQSGEDDALEPDLTVFDLGDIFEFRREARDAAQGGTLGEVELRFLVSGGFLRAQRLGTSGEDTIEHRFPTLFVSGRHSFLCSWQLLYTKYNAHVRPSILPQPFRLRRCRSTISPRAPRARPNAARSPSISPVAPWPWRR
ncbi:Uncharacterised protein [Mycobacteroides abscessus subsp. abscessus]|nr:Uncharacterised protein [Mycobacteroides abscessus subsp. abscessus]